MSHLNSRLVLNAWYIPIARSDTQAGFTCMHVHYSHTLMLIQLKDVPA